MVLNTRVSNYFSEPMRTTVRGIFANGDTVVTLWDGVAPIKDGQTYRNAYGWFVKMRDGRVIEATTFLDPPTYDAAIAGAQRPPWPVD